MSLVKAMFTLGVEEGDTFEGWYYPDVRWNGFAAPRFDLATVRKIKVLFDKWAAEMPDSDIETIKIDADNRVFVESDWGRHEVRPSTEVECDGPLYSIGNFAWTWMEVPNPGGE